MELCRTRPVGDDLGILVIREQFSVGYVRCRFVLGAELTLRWRGKRN
jgi:hypothetical protein